MSDFKETQHGRNHRPGGSDPIPGIGGLQFNEGTYGPENLGDWLHVETTGDDGDFAGSVFQQSTATDFTTRSTLKLVAAGTGDSDEMTGLTIDSSTTSDTPQAYGEQIQSTVTGDTGDVHASLMQASCVGDDGVSVGLEVEATTQVTTPDNLSPATGLKANAITDGDGEAIGARITATTSGDADSVAAELEAIASGSGSPYAIRSTGGTVRIQLRVGEAFEIFDHLANPIFRVEEDGDVHILTGTTIIADL